jgi:hypothetical protein
MYIQLFEESIKIFNENVRQHQQKKIKEIIEMNAQNKAMKIMLSRNKVIASLQLKMSCIKY